MLPKKSCQLSANVHIRSHACQELVFTHNSRSHVIPAVTSFPQSRHSRSHVIPAQAGTQALRPFSLGTRLRGYDGIERGMLEALGSYNNRASLAILPPSWRRWLRTTNVERINCLDLSSFGFARKICEDYRRRFFGSRSADGRAVSVP